MSAAVTGRLGEVGADGGQSQPPPLPYELRIGVTGHRTLDDPAGVARAVRVALDHLSRAFDEASAEPRGMCGAAQARWRRGVAFLARALNLLGARLPVTLKRVPAERRTSIQWTVVSPLARGADRVVAEAVLERPDARLDVLLPFPREEYERDFANADDLAEFRRLLARAAIINVASQAPDAPTDAERHALRNVAYYRVGQAVVDGSEVLIAVWDGQHAAGHGGTAEIISYALQRERVVLWIHATHPADPVRILRLRHPTDPGDVVVRLSAAGSTEDSTGTVDAVAAALPQRARDLSSNFHQLAAYNRDTAFDVDEYREIYQYSLGGFTADPRPPDPRWQDVLRIVLPHYARADQLAVRYQWLYTRAASALFYLSAAAVTLAVLQVLFLPAARWPIIGEIAIMIGVVVLLGLSLEGAWREKWLQARHLAEQLRIAFFSSIAGVHSPASHVRPANALPFYRGPDTWVFATVDRVAAACPHLSAGPDNWESVRAFLSTKWVAAQHCYHQSNAARRYRGAHRTHVAGLWLFGGTLVAATLHLLDAGHRVAPRWGSAPESIDALAVACAIALPAWGAASHAVNALLERERIAARSRQMARVLGEIGTRMNGTQRREEFLAEVERARDVMLTETHEWLVSLSFRGPVLPA